jgi:predicted transcriptional regulator
MGSYRSKLEIIADVLGVVRGGAKKTQIMYQANLSYRLLTRYLKDVIDMGLVSIEGGNTYELTEKGCDFLREFKDYHQHSLEIEEQLSAVQDKKMMLENQFLNAKETNSSLNNCSNEKMKRRRNDA